MSDLLQQVGTKYLRNLPLQDCEWSWMSPVADSNVRSSDLATLQCGILNTICMFHSGNSELVSRALADRFYLVEACAALYLLSPRGLGWNSRLRTGTQRGALAQGAIVDENWNDDMGRSFYKQTTKRFCR